MTMETGGPLDDGGIAASSDPFELFQDWMRDAQGAEPNDPNAMALATAGEGGMPNVRMVLLKGADAGGFVFYSNAGSAKGRELVYMILFMATFTALTGFGLGIVEGLTKVYYPPASATVVFVALAIVLLVRPAGLFGKA